MGLMTAPRFLGFLLALSALVPLTVAYSKLDDDALRAIPSGGDVWDLTHGSLLAPILIPRVPGTPGSAKTQKHFLDFFREHLPLWTIDWHNSTSKTPATGDKDIPFTNLIFRRDPPWAASGDVSRLTLAAHYDTLYEPSGFIGAIDSAAPCAMLLQVAKNIEGGLAKKWDAMKASGEAGSGLEEEVGVQIVLLDGEEAWVDWTDTDSLYGARALAEAWEATTHPGMSIFKNQLASISLFFLVDLLGSKDPNVPSYFPETHWAYKHLAKVESRLRSLDVLESGPSRPFLPHANRKPQPGRGYIADDHVPFMQRGVSILHVIPNPFPPQWHTMADDAEHLDIPTIRDWTRIVTAFVAEWLEIGEHMDKKAESEARQERARAVHSDDL